MKIESLVVDVTAAGSPDRAECAILGVIEAGRVFGQSRSFLWSGSLLWCRNPILSSNYFTYGHLMKIEWLVTNITAVEPPGRAKRAILGVISAGRIFGQFRTHLWLLLSHFVM